MDEISPLAKLSPNTLASPKRLRRQSSIKRKTTPAWSLLILCPNLFNKHLYLFPPVNAGSRVQAPIPPSRDYGARRVDVSSLYGSFCEVCHEPAYFFVPHGEMAMWYPKSGDSAVRTSIWSALSPVASISEVSRFGHHPSASTHPS